MKTINTVGVANGSRTIQEIHSALPERGGQISDEIDKFEEETNFPLYSQSQSFLKVQDGGHLSI